MVRVSMSKIYYDHPLCHQVHQYFITFSNVCLDFICGQIRSFKLLEELTFQDLIVNLRCGLSFKF